MFKITLSIMIVKAIRSREKMEAASGFEPLHKGFADLSLATWVRRRFITAENDI